VKSFVLFYSIVRAGYNLLNSFYLSHSSQAVLNQPDFRPCSGNHQLSASHCNFPVFHHPSKTAKITDPIYITQAI